LPAFGFRFFEKTFPETVIPDIFIGDPFFKAVFQTWIPAFAGMTTLYETISS